MKKYDLSILLVGFLLSIIPVYVNLGWVLLCVKYPELNHLETVALFHSNILFGLISNSTSAGIATTLCGLIAGLLMLISLMNTLQYNINIQLKTIKVILFVINVLFTAWSLFGLM